MSYSTTQKGNWSSGLCDCFSDCGSCCLTFCCPCITFGRVAEIVDKGQSSCFASGCIYTCLMYVGCHWIYSCTYRSKLKYQLGISSDELTDCCTHFWCEPCALCQEYRELQHRGYDMALGWHGNELKKNQAVRKGVPRMMSMSRNDGVEE